MQLPSPDSPLLCLPVRCKRPQQLALTCPSPALQVRRVHPLRLEVSGRGGLHVAGQLHHVRPVWLAHPLRHLPGALPGRPASHRVPAVPQVSSPAAPPARSPTRTASWLSSASSASGKLTRCATCQEPYQDGQLVIECQQCLR